MGAGLVAAVIAGDINDIVRAHPVALLLDATDALPDMVEPLAGGRPRQAVAQFLKLALEARGESLGHASLLLRPRLGVAIEARLGAVDDLVDMDALARAGLEGDRQVRVEVARSDPGRAMRAMTVAVASARSVAPKPRRSSALSNPSCLAAHRPTASTPTERGRTRANEFTPGARHA